MSKQLALFDFDDLHERFLKTELGQLYQAIPWDAVCKQFVNPKPPRSRAGRRPIFTLKGGLGLMFLKHYTGLSDAKLIQALNTNWAYQLFCDIVPSGRFEVKDRDIVGRFRAFFGHHLKLDDFQQVLAGTWKPFMENTSIGMMDATVYESYIKHPTTVKLLFDCIKWTRKSIKAVCKAQGIRRPRSKYKEIKTRFLHYSKCRKKTHKQTRKITQSLLHLSQKLILQLSALDYYAVLDEPGEYQIKLIKTVIDQQTILFEDSDAKIPERIVCLFKPYIRPIKRGKENKPTEFGAKVHLHQVGGCNFIEHLSFNAFHEGIRLPDTVRFHIKLFGKLTAIAADGIYPTNANRTFCRENNIVTNFVRKGKIGKHEDQKEKMRTVLNKARATRLEGSFGNEKNNYLLRKVKARSKETEIAWIIFGVHTANAVKMAKIMAAKKAEIVNQAA